MTRAKFDNEAFHEDVWTSDQEGLRRLKTDGGQASFDENRQFRYFDRWGNISEGDQIVYLATLAEPINLTGRDVRLHIGGREYLSYINDGSHTFTGTLVDSGRISPANNNVAGGGAHPAPTVVIQRAIGPNIFTEGSLPLTGDITVSSGNVNQASGSYSPDEDKIGAPGGASFWLVFNHVGSNTPTYGSLLLNWEELV